MSNKQDNSVLTEDFLYELFSAAFKSTLIAGIVAEHIQPSFLPDAEFQALQKAIHLHYKAYKKCPTYGIMMQKFATKEDVVDLIAEIRDTEYEGTIDGLVDDLEEYIVGVKAAQMYEEFGQLYSKGKRDEANAALMTYADWKKSFTLKGESFVEVISTFEARHLENKIKVQAQRASGVPPVTRFYIDDLDVLNKGKNLRTQAACFLASTGVGKSHAARHIGKSAAEDGLNVLHFQLEGSKDEVLDAYSASLISENSFNYENARITDRQMQKIKEQLAELKGTIRVRSFPRFNNQVSTVDIANGIAEYRKAVGCNPDIVIIDSMDLMTDASGKHYAPKDERYKRVGVVNDLKDIAGEENCFIVTTTQANINERAWLNDPKNVLTEYNSAESKGIARPLTWLISLNQTTDEAKDNSMRIHVAKSRFTKKGSTFKIATDFDNEIFYDRERTLTLQRLSAAAE